MNPFVFVCGWFEVGNTGGEEGWLNLVARGDGNVKLAWATNFGKQ